MNTPKGFGKNYFSLASIQATTTMLTINATASRHESLCLYTHDTEKEDEESPPDELLLLTLPLTKRCNCVFNQQCRLALKNAKFRGTPKCNCRHLSHRKTGISPPLNSF